MMINEHVLEELTRRTPMRQLLVAECWPDLTTESRLQIIDTISRGDGLPTWLAILAIDDKASIVRFWAARRYRFRAPRENQPRPFPIFATETSEDDKYLYEKAEPILPSS